MRQRHYRLTWKLNLASTTDYLAKLSFHTKLWSDASKISPWSSVHAERTNVLFSLFLFCWFVFDFKFLPFLFRLSFSSLLLLLFSLFHHFCVFSFIRFDSFNNSNGWTCPNFLFEVSFCLHFRFSLSVLHFVCLIFLS